ncbi:amidohydrolase family protein [Cohnella lubricantis]|uniref:Amidohydrolase family protein n=2 Tax=Cohnella lubricantis TaxID=2163172 RepID=A0A841TB33_9BACL|nr:amidohydrolase family protein [Cohnella lubricantis]
MKKVTIALGEAAAIATAVILWLAVPALGQPNTAAPSAQAKGAALRVAMGGVNSPSREAAAAPAGDGVDTPTPEELARTYDIVIRGGRVINPETRLDREGLSVAIEDGRIALVTDKRVHGRREIDASGLVVAPGFIDNLSYDPNPLGVWNKLADGVTSNIAMHGGTAHPDKWYAYYTRSKLPIHFGASFFYSQARNQFALSRYDSATPAETAILLAQAEKALNDGALGISFSLEYVPGIRAPEILPMMRLAYKYNVPVYFHARYSDMEEPGTNLEAVNELIGYAKSTGASVHVDHINSTGGTFSMKQSLGMLEEARREGLDMTACTYPYDYWGTYLNSARFDEGWQERFRISYHDLQIAGTPERLTEETFKVYKRQGKLAVAYAIPEQDIMDSLRAPFVMIGSDAILEPGYNNHPRASGTFARTVGLYVREHEVLPLIDAIAKMTLMPAQRLERQAPALQKKGRIARGMDADIVVFDYGTISDRSTVEKPNLTSAGIKYVLVGGQVALDGQGLHRGVRLGQPIRSEFVRVRGSVGTLTAGRARAALVAYRGERYVDAAVLEAQGCELRWSKPDRAYKLAAAARAPAANTLLPPPPDGELMLERGHRLLWEGGEAELLSIGDRSYVSLETLQALGWTLTPGEAGNWRAEASAA